MLFFLEVEAVDMVYLTVENYMTCRFDQTGG